MANFEQAYGEWIGKHAGRRRGERLRRFKEGHGHAEKLFAETVWWPAFGSFDKLHPEYEVFDFKDGSRFLDFAYIQGDLRVCVEIDGFGPHRRDADRKQFADELNRQNHLVIDGWLVIRFAYDDVKERPRQCQQTLQQLFGKRLGAGAEPESLTVLEKEAIRTDARQNGIVRPGALFAHLGVGRKKGNKLIDSLICKKWLDPVPNKFRIRAYQLNDKRRLPV
ncbi:DNA-binding response regulator [Paenibacillus sp. GYB003]|uniref:DNA-binding response regulator n=1 Tax=Paenibacillus sp. GYB003 TaxID=2994392 RepID=UPI002F967AB3